MNIAQNLRGIYDASSTEFGFIPQSAFAGTVFADAANAVDAQFGEVSINAIAKQLDGRPECDADGDYLVFADGSALRFESGSAIHPIAAFVRNTDYSSND